MSSGMERSVAPGSLRGLGRAVIRRPLALASLTYLLVVTVAALAADVLAPYDPSATDLAHVLSEPTALHLLGTDSLGRDVLSRLMFGGQVSLAGVGEAVLTLTLLGVSVGVVAGFVGGWTDRAASWVLDVMLALPGIVILLVVLAIFGTNNTAAMITVGVLGAPHVARVVRGATLAVRGEPYVAAARVAGLPRWRIMLGQVLPRVSGPILVQASLQAGGALLAQAGLSYLGLIAQPPTPTWGGMVADGSEVIDQQPWLLFPPGLVIGLAILAFGLLGDALRDATAERTAPAARRRRGRRRHVATRAEVPEQDIAPVTPLAVRELTITLRTPAGDKDVVEGVDLDIAAGETVGLVGESGCGKSITGRALLGLLPAGADVTAGRIVFDGSDLAGLPQRAWRDIRGSGIALVSQEPLGSLDPVFSVGRQVAELVRRHHGGSRSAARERALRLLGDVRLPDAEAIACRYPHELSGGMAQRVAIAMALAGAPRLLIADEPTTALDVTVQAEILELLRTLQRDNGMSILLISHDWGVVAQLCQRAYVMYAGHVVESAAVDNLFRAPQHPYSAALLGCSPGRSRPHRPLRAIPGTVPAVGDWPQGCHFQSRCRFATPECAAGAIPLVEPDPGHRTRCLHHTDVEEEGDDVPVRSLA